MSILVINFLDILNKVVQLTFKAKKLTILFVAFLLSSAVYATPKSVELWFLSIDKTTWLKDYLKKHSSSSFYAQSVQCQPMGDYCFDPQIGLYKKGEEESAYKKIDMAEIEMKESYDFIDPHKGVERKLIECDENAGFFDIFCGKKQKIKKQKQNHKFEVWIDVSSTMKQVDYRGVEKKCYREMFLENLSLNCPMNEKMKVYYFEEFRKEAGTFDRVCLSRGLNNMKRIVSDLKKSKADHVLIITDIFEAEESFINAVELTGRATIRGLDKPFYASQMKEELKRIGQLCQ